MVPNYSPMDTSRSAEEAQAAQAAKDLQKYRAARSKKSKDELKLEKAGGDILDIIPDFIKYLSLAIPEFWNDVDKIGLVTAPQLLLKNAIKNQPNWDIAIPTEWSNITSLPTTIGTDFISWFLKDALGVELEAQGLNSKTAVNTMSLLSSFLIQVPVIIAGISWAGKIVLGERFDAIIGEQLRAFTGELGLNFMVGGLLQQIFEQATGAELRELINVQKHPNRLEWPQVRTLFKQHYQFPKGVDWELEKLGYAEEQRNMLKALDENQLPITDISNAWLQGLMNPDEVDTYLKKLGYSDGDISILKSLYINHASTQADSILRSEARRLFAEDHISQAQFEQILKLTNVPKKAIAVEIAAINLEKTYGRMSLSVAQIKQMRLENILDDRTATKHLVEHGYTADSAAELLKLWQLPPIQHPKTVTASKVLAYMHSGLMTPKDAFDRLMQQGYTTKDANFLVQHPTTKATNAKFDLTPPTIVKAYVDGVINVDVAKTNLLRLGVSERDANYLLSIAANQVATHNHTKQGTQHITKADIKEAFDIGVIKQPEAVTMLEHIGYWDSDAMFIVSTWYYKLNPEKIPQLGGSIIMPDPGQIAPIYMAPIDAVLSTEGFVGSYQDTSTQQSPFVEQDQTMPSLPSEEQVFPDTFDTTDTTQIP